MAIAEKKTGSVLLIQGIDVSKPAEYLSEQSCTNSLNFEVESALLKKRKGTSVVAGQIAIGGGGGGEM
jgi:hypothetical protein